MTQHIRVEEYIIKTKKNLEKARQIKSGLNRSASFTRLTCTVSLEYFQLYYVLGFSENVTQFPRNVTLFPKKVTWFPKNVTGFLEKKGLLIFSKLLALCYS